MSESRQPWNKRSFRRLLIDTQIPDWDEGFLANYDPDRVASQVEASGATAAMVYFLSHVGLANWPTRTGVQHAAFCGRDPIGETVAALHERDIAVCAYYSVNFNNQAYVDHPEWRSQFLSHSSINILPRPRYGLCCPNNPGYRQLVHDQTREILEGYDVDAFFFDMIWWMGVCGCDHCRDRYRREAGAELPEVVDWTDPAWCRFQKAREDWITALAVELRDLVHKHRPGLQVYHNFAVAMASWLRSVSFDSAKGHDFLGGDFYGGRSEQLAISRLMINLSETRPVEFMTTVAANLLEHVSIKNRQQLEIQTFAAMASSSAFLMIAAFDPDGRLEKRVPGLIRSIYDRTAPYEPYLGGEPVEDIAVYCSSDSKMNFTENGMALSDVPPANTVNYPHSQAVVGACEALQRAHLPFGVITRKQLDVLDRYRVIVLPNLLRMTPEEVAAFRAYVERGGKLYASRWTSLTDTSGVRHSDFALADVFGCHAEAAEDGPLVHIRPREEGLAAAILPQREVTQWRDANEKTGALRLAEKAEGCVLATLSLPYGYPSTGSVEGRDWASIHSYSPWEQTVRPVVVENDFGKGRAIYSAADIEGGSTGQHNNLFVALIRRLLGVEPRFEVDTHPMVWVTAFDQADEGRTIVSFLNYQNDLPVLPVDDVRFSLRPPQGKRFGSLYRAPGGEAIAFETDEDGTIRGSLETLEVFEMIVAVWEDKR